MFQAWFPRRTLHETKSSAVLSSLSTANNVEDERITASSICHDWAKYEEEEAVSLFSSLSFLLIRREESTKRKSSSWSILLDERRNDEEENIPLRRFLETTKRYLRLINTLGLIVPLFRSFWCSFPLMNFGPYEGTESKGTEGTEGILRNSLRSLAFPSFEKQRERNAEKEFAP